MLEPAIAHRDELVSLFAKEIYSDDYFYYVGYPHWFGIPEIGTASGDEGWGCDVRWAILDGEKVIGYFAYRIDSICNSVSRFGLYSFDRGNPIIGIDIFRKLEELVKRFHRVEWRVVEGNPVIRHYDRFCERHRGRKVVLHHATKGPDGEYLDEYLYEIVKEGD